MLVQGTWNKLLAPGLKKAFEASYGEQVEYAEVTQILGKDQKPYTVVKYWYRPIDGKFHVFDLGDEMLVPCDMVKDLFGK